MKIRVHLSIGYPTAEQEDVLEIADDATEEKIESEILIWANEHIETWYEVLADGEEE